MPRRWPAGAVPPPQRPTATIMMVSRFALFFGGGRGSRNANPVALVAMMILAPLAATGARLGGRADGLVDALRKIEAAARRTPLPAAPLAQATEHMFIVKPFSGSGAVQLFSTHMPTEESIRRLMALTKQVHG